jgi:hypothetical protein
MNGALLEAGEIDCRRGLEAGVGKSWALDDSKWWLTGASRTCRTRSLLRRLPIVVLPDLIQK